MTGLVMTEAGLATKVGGPDKLRQLQHLKYLVTQTISLYIISCRASHLQHPRHHQHDETTQGGRQPAWLYALPVIVYYLA